MFNFSFKNVKYFNFVSGARWRLPNDHKHYEWSKNYCMSPEGLDNTSTSEKSFYYITLKGNTDVAYIYNTNLFELKGYDPSNEVAF